jgi:hypothetical protein
MPAMHRFAAVGFVLLYLARPFLTVSGFTMHLGLRSAVVRLACLATIRFASKRFAYHHIACSAQDGSAGQCNVKLR